MVSWQNGKLTKCQDGKMASQKMSSWQNVELKKCQIEKVDKMPSQQNVTSTRGQVDKPKSWHGSTLIKRQVDKMAA